MEKSDGRVPTFLKSIGLMVIGTAIAAFFGIVIIYPELLASSKENAANIKANTDKIERLWDAHQISHIQNQTKGE